MNKKLIVALLALMFIAGQVFAQSRKDIDDFFKSFETLVIEREQLSKKQTITVADFEALMKKEESLKLDEKTNKLITLSSWEEKDKEKYRGFKVRIMAASQTIVQKIMAGYSK